MTQFLHPSRKITDNVLLIAFWENDDMMCIVSSDNITEHDQEALGSSAGL